MSLADAYQFLERMDNDPGFAQQVTGCADAISRGEFVKSEGLEFTVGELMQALKGSNKPAASIGIDLFVSRLFSKQCIGIDCGN